MPTPTWDETIEAPSWDETQPIDVSVGTLRPPQVQDIFDQSAAQQRTEFNPPPEDVARATEFVQKPLVPPQYIPTYWMGKALEKVPNEGVQGIGGQFESMADMVSGLTSPTNIAIAGAAPELLASKPAQVALAAGFEGKAIADREGIAKSITDAPTVSEKSRAIANALMAYGLPPAALLGLAAKGKPQIPERNLAPQDSGVSEPKEVSEAQYQSQAAKEMPNVEAEDGKLTDTSRVQSEVPRQSVDPTQPEFQPQTSQTQAEPTSPTSASQLPKDLESETPAAQGQSDVPGFEATPTVAYHGSPHDFTAFDLERIGSDINRGGTSFGLGVNLTKDVAHARAYADKGFIYRTELPKEAVKSFISWEQPVPKTIAEQIPELDMSKPLPFGGGATVENVAGTWKLKSGDTAFTLSAREVNRMFGEENTGEQVYRKLVAALNGDERAASKWLLDRGVKGITNRTERGAENYTVFDASLAKIISRENLSSKKQQGQRGPAIRTEQSGVVSADEPQPTSLKNDLRGAQAEAGTSSLRSRSETSSSQKTTTPSNLQERSPQIQQPNESPQAGSVSAKEAAAIPPEDLKYAGVPSDEPFISRIANRFTKERSARGDIGEIRPGEGFATQDLVQRGLRMGPEEVNQHISDIMQRSGGDPIAQAAAIRGEEARLSQRSHQLSRIAEENPSLAARMAADNAFKDLTDFHNGPVARLKQNFHAQGMALQGEVPVDLGTVNGLREAWLKETGKAPPANMDTTFRRVADNVKRSTADERATLTKLGREIDTEVARRRVSIKPESLRDVIIERMKNQPCR